jgi:hypothetical protein
VRGQHADEVEQRLRGEFVSLVDPEIELVSSNTACLRLSIIYSSLLPTPSFLFTLLGDGRPFVKSIRLCHKSLTLSSFLFYLYE